MEQRPRSLEGLTVKDTSRRTHFFFGGRGGAPREEVEGGDLFFWREAALQSYCKTLLHVWMEGVAQIGIQVRKLQGNKSQRRDKSGVVVSACCPGPICRPSSWSKAAAQLWFKLLLK